MRILRCYGLTLSLMTAVCALSAQQQTVPEEQPPTPDHPLYKLHVYTNRVQFAALVLDSDLLPVQRLTREKFAITIDSGPYFHPTTARIAGDDALSIAVLLDASGSQNDIVKSFAKAFSDLVPQLLHPKDHISIYAQDCNVVRSLLDTPANSVTTAKAIELALSATGLHGTAPKPGCSRSLRLWEGIARAGADLAEVPGRRVLLVVSSGYDKGSTISSTALSQFISSKSIAMFGMRELDTGVPTETESMARNLRLRVMPALPAEDPFRSLCERNGGIIVSATARYLSRSLERFVNLLRNRYIIEYPRPDNMEGALHMHIISVPGLGVTVRSTGASVPMADPTIAADPNTLPSAPSPARVGTRRPLPQKP